MSQSFTQERLKRLELKYIEIETLSLAKLSHKRLLPSPFTLSLQPPDSKVMKRLATHSVKLFSNGSNSNLFAYSYMLLVTIYDQLINENLLSQLKSLLYEEALDLTKIQHHPFPEVSNDEMKKLMVEFIFELQFTDHSKALPKALQKHPIVLHIIVLFLRALLAKFGIAEAGEYGQPIPTQSAFEVLSELLDINYRHLDSSYIFMESHCVIQERDADSVMVGHYFESKPPSLASDSRENQESNQQLNKMPSLDRKYRSFNFEGTIRESQYHEGDAPTPFFNLTTDQRSDFRTDKKDTFVELNPYSSVPELKFGFRVSEDDENEADLSNQSFEEKLKMLKNEDNGWKSPIFNNGIILDDADNAFTMFETANQEAFTRKTSKGSLSNQVLDSNNESCSCTGKKQGRNKLCSRLYEINILSVGRGSEWERDELDEPSFDCMIISIKNIFSSRAESQSARPINKTKRAQTFYDLHTNSISDFEKSFESVDPRTPKSALNKTQLNTSYLLSKVESRIKMVEQPARMPKIKFTYSNNKL